MGQCWLARGASARDGGQKGVVRRAAGCRRSGAHLPHRQGAAGILMAAKIQLGEIAVDVVKKEIKNVHLSVYPPNGNVRISAPLRMDLDTIRVFAISKLGWIKQQQKKMRGQEREPPREYLDRESHYVWGKRYLLKIIERDATPTLELKHRKIVLRVRPGIREDKKQAIVDEWYRAELRKAVVVLIGKWEPLMGVK